jgi:hypothetical protein
MLPTVTKRIADCDYTITLLSADEGLPINALLLRVAGPTIATLVSEAGDFKTLADIPWAAFAAAFRTAVHNLDAADLRQLVDAFAPKTLLKLPDGKKPVLSDVFGVHFAGKYGRMYQWLGFCIQANFADFLDYLPVSVRSAAVAAPAP